MLKNSIRIIIMDKIYTELAFVKSIRKEKGELF